MDEFTQNRIIFNGPTTLKGINFLAILSYQWKNDGSEYLSVKNLVSEKFSGSHLRIFSNYSPINFKI